LEIYVLKIIRYQDGNGQIGHAVLQADGSALKISGDILSEHQVSSEKADVDKLLAPIDPRHIFCIGLNYKLHAEETNKPLPEHPIIFTKSPSNVQNPGDPILLPTTLKSNEVDYECELAVIIGKTGKNISNANALDHVLGYTCGNDVSARDWQAKWGGGQWCRGKTFDTFCPLGPSIVTTDEIANPNNLAIKTILNGQAVQDWKTDDMIFDVPALIEFLSASNVLEAGTVILTGTPQGVGAARTPPLWLKEGDTVSIEIEKIGTLTNPVQSE
jgi:2-keto-4-pentenoate hydratase/2-oxohepta-3-ene-1,7-dioic acid hydratase in catechol pathway